jgi:hypothetical protein
VRQFARSQTLRTGRTAATDALIQPGPGWERADGSDTALATSTPDATLTVPFTGTDLAVVGTGGSVRLIVDGKERGTVALASSANGMTRLASNLADGPHTVILRSTGGTVRLGSFFVQRRAAFGWVLPLLTLGVVLIGAGAISTVIAETLGTIEDFRSRKARRRSVAAMRETSVR